MMNKSYYQFGFETLGPVVNVYITKLHSYLCKCSDPDSKILFLLRAGLRIHDLYRSWLENRNAALPANIALMKCSRMLGIKAAFAFNEPLSTGVIQKELNAQPLHTILNCLLRPEIDSGRNSLYSSRDLPPITLAEFLVSKTKQAEDVRDYLTNQSTLFEKYLSHIAGDAKRLLLIDTGWKGTTQLLLEGAFPDYQWIGLYFGCIGRNEVNNRRPESMHGIMFDSPYFTPDIPETAFRVHRHLIESLFEPGIPSFEHISAADVGRAIKSDDLLKNESLVEWDEVFDGVKSYLAEHATDPLGKMFSDYQTTMESLAQKLCYPSVEDIEYARGKQRSHDMGRHGGVDTILPVEDRHIHDSSEVRIRQSIWKTGQAALELPEIHARSRQREILSTLMDPSTRDYFTIWTDSRKTDPSKTSNHVAIITRTKNRPILLKRAAESVFRQTFENYTWIIVNDGGILEDVQEVVKASPVDPTKVVICSNKESLGMEAASNVGIRSRNSDYIIIHDDDDSWAPSFLSETVHFLEANTGQKYGGVITMSVYVSEEIQGDQVIEHNRVPYKDWVQSIQITEMWNENIFPPIAFLFRRSIWESLNGYDENLPVLGDWDFNLRFLIEADIGVLPQPLAFYHHRDAGICEQQYSNSVIGGISKHLEYNTIVRNKFIRLSAKNGNPMGVLAAIGYQTQDLRHRIAQTNTPPIRYQAPPQYSENTVREQPWISSDDQMLLSQISIHIRKKRLSLLKPFLLKQIRSLQEEGQPLSQKQVLRLVKQSGIRFKPSDDFNEAAYLKRNPDVAQSVAAGEHPNGYHHYLLYGRYEKRSR